MTAAKGHKSRLKPGQVAVSLTLMRLSTKRRRGEAASENLAAVVDEATAERLRALLQDYAAFPVQDSQPSQHRGI